VGIVRSSLSVDHLNRMQTLNPLCALLHILSFL
jgi:hypothetical protein